MKDLNYRINTVVQLGVVLAHMASDTWPGYASGLNQSEFDAFKEQLAKAEAENAWFTSDQIKHALMAIAESTRQEKIEKWIKPHRSKLEEGGKVKNIALILAGNIPLVGLHDVLTILVSGHHVQLKYSSKDTHLMQAVMELMVKISPELKKSIQWVSEAQRLSTFDAVIATGSNSAANHFQYYFGKYPNIIRKNRNSVALIEGDETEEQLALLGKDLFTYYGLGCRNVSKLFIPEDYDLDLIFKAIYPFHTVAEHPKYKNNYDYYKTIFLLNNEALLDNGFVVFKEDDKIASPVGTIFYERYQQLAEVNAKLKEKKSELQCIVSKTETPFGKTQHPELWDYADGEDTLKFLTDLY